MEKKLAPRPPWVRERMAPKRVLKTALIPGRKRLRKTADKATPKPIPKATIDSLRARLQRCERELKSLKEKKTRTVKPTTTTMTNGLKSYAKKIDDLVSRVAEGRLRGNSNYENNGFIVFEPKQPKKAKSKKTNFVILDKFGKPTTF